MHETSTSSIGNRLKSLRLKAGLSEAQFARLCSIQIEQLHRLELGQAVPSTRFLEAAEKGGIDVNYVLTGRIY